MVKPAYKRVLLKLSGEALKGSDDFGINLPTLQSLASQIREIHGLGVQLGLVIGGGNIFRGIAASAQGMDRASADYMGMIATVMNGVAMQDALEKIGVQTRVMSAIEMHQIAEVYIRRRAIRHMEKGRVVIFAGGTGNPFFTTDTAAALRAMEIQAEIIIKGTKVDGVYNKDPVTNSDATMYETLRYMEVLEKGLHVMDSTAISLCMDNKLPIAVFNLTKEGNIRRIVLGENVGTIVSVNATRDIRSNQ